MVQPSSKRDGFSTIPDVKWEDVGAHDLLREEFYDNIIRPIKYPEDYEVIFNTTLFMQFLLIKVNSWVKQFRKIKYH